MNNKLNLGRRRFLYYAGFGIASQGILTSGIYVLNIEYDDKKVFNKLKFVVESIFTDTKNVKFIGKRYLELYPENAKIHSLLTKSGLGKICQTHNILESAFAFDAQCKQDFTNGRTIEVGGYILAEAEVSAYGLIYLLSDEYLLDDEV